MKITKNKWNKFDLSTKLKLSLICKISVYHNQNMIAKYAQQAKQRIQNKHSRQKRILNIHRALFLKTYQQTHLQTNSLSYKLSSDSRSHAK